MRVNSKKFTYLGFQLFAALPYQGCLIQVSLGSLRRTCSFPAPGGAGLLRRRTAWFPSLSLPHGRERSVCKMLAKLPCKSLAPLYRQFLRACEKTFRGDLEAQRTIYCQMRNVIRYNTLNLSEEELKKELNMAIDFVR